MKVALERKCRKWTLITKHIINSIYFKIAEWIQDLQNEESVFVIIANLPKQEPSVCSAKTHHRL